MRHRRSCMKLMSVVILLCCAFAANAYPVTYYATTSKLASGRWVKIKVNKTGIHEITNEELVAMGFDNPSAVCVYGFGGVFLGNTFETSLPDDLKAQPVYRMSDKLIFYGESDVRINLASDLRTPDIKRNTYSLAGYYFLSDVSPYASPSPSNMSFNTSASYQKRYHTSISVIEKEETCPANASSRFFGENFKYTPSQTFEFIAKQNPDSVFAEQYTDEDFHIGHMSYSWGGKSINEMTINMVANGLTVVEETHKALPAITSASELTYNWKDGSMRVQLLPDDSVYTFTASVNSRASIEFAAIDYIAFSYKRNNYVGDVAQLRMIFDNVSSNYQFVLTGATENTKVWNVTSPIDVFAYRTAFDSKNGILKGTFEKKYSASTNGHAYLIAFDPTKTQYKVEFAGVVANQNLHSKSSPDMLIITNESMREYAEQLAEYHRLYQGMRVYVYDQNEIFNEFSSGTPSAMAYKRCAKMFYDRNPVKFKYLLLYGAGSYDNRGVIIERGDNLLTYQNENKTDINDETRAFCSDAYFGMLSDDYDHSRIHYSYMDVNVSRIPVSSPEDAMTVNAKTLDYLLNPPMNSSRNKALMLCDNEDMNSHLYQTEEVCNSILKIAPYVTLTKSYCSLYPWTEAKDAREGRRVTTQALADGQQFMFYTGHGKPESIASEVLWSMTLAEETNYDIPPIVFMATCNAVCFDRGGNIAESMLYKNNGGSIAVISSNRTVYRDCNQVLSLDFAKSLFSASPDATIGDVYRIARNNTIKMAVDSIERIYGINTLCFNMIGDPALPINAPEYKVVTKSINGEDVASGSKCDLFPFYKNVIQGEIADTSGVVDRGFNGTVTILIYDAPVAVNTHNQGGKDEIVSIMRDEDLLVELSVPVVNGVFTAQVVMPEPARPMIGNRISYYAASSDYSKAANGVFTDAVVQNYTEDKVFEDTTAPEISEMYLDSPSFANGDYVAPETVLYATILPDESGLCQASMAVGMATKLVLDGSKSYSEVKGMLASGQNGVTTLEFPIDGLQDGYHTLTLSVADNMGNRSERTIFFYVLNRSVTSVLSVEESPAREKATLNLEHDFHYEPVGRVVVEDVRGNVVYSAEDASFPFDWNLVDNDGNKVNDGVYYGYAILKAQKQYSSTRKVKIIVVKQ